MADSIKPDICIVGAGALGITLALHARQLGATVVLVERERPEPLDGPGAMLRLASLRASASAIQTQRRAKAWGIVGADPKVSMKAVQERAEAVAAEQAVLASADHLRAKGITVLSGPVAFSDANTLNVGEAMVRARRFIMALGSRPLVPSLPGLDEAGYFTPDTILDNGRKLTHLLVMGGTPEAVSLAQVFARLGSAVTLVSQGPLLEGFDAEAVVVLMAALEAEGVTIIDDVAVTAVQPRSQGIGATLAKTGGAGERQLDLSHILVAMGAEPAFDGLEAVCPQGGKVGNRRIQLVGPAAGRWQWGEALSHGCAVIESAVGATKRSMPHVPKLVMTEPELAEFGTGLPDKGPTEIHRASFAENPAALVAGETAGFAKVVTDSKGQVRSATILGAGASGLAATLAMAAAAKLPLDALSGLPLPHPSLFTVLADLGQSRVAQHPVKAAGWQAALGSALKR